MNMKKALIALAVLALLAVASLAIYLGVKKKNDTTDGGETDSRFPLKHNPHVKYDIVKDLQAKLNKKLEACIEPNFPKNASGQYIKTLSEDGYFGDDTLAVVKYFFDGKEEVTLRMYNSL